MHKPNKPGTDQAGSPLSLATEGPPLVRIVHARLGPRLTPEEFARRAGELPARLTQDLGRFQRWQDRQARLWGLLILERSLLDLGLKGEPLNGLARGPWGRPFLSGGPEFNLSHSGEMVLCALSWRARLGVDIEMVRPLELDDLAASFLPQEWREITAHPDPLTRFYDFWTAKEAVCKAEGLGLSLPLQEIRLEDGQALCRGRAWHLRPLALAPGYRGCLAVDRATVELVLEQTKP